MPKLKIPITDIQVQKSKPGDKDYKLTDCKGLYLLVTTTGGKLWRFDYRFNNKRKTLSFKSYPEISLSKARQLRDDARQLLANDIDPAEFKKTQKASKAKEVDNTFEVIARQWYEQEKHRWSDNHSSRLLKRLENDIFPAIGNMPITSIRTPEMEDLLKRVAIRTLETAHRLKIAIDMIYRYAIRNEFAVSNPVAALKGVLPPIKNKPMAAPTDPRDVAPLLRAIDGFEGSYIVKCAMLLAPLLFVRPGELRHAEWVEIDFENAQWNIPAEKMKMRQPHVVPLSEQAITIMKGLHKLTGNGRYLFPCQRSTLKCMSENAVNAGLRRLGFEKDEITGHGFRAMARTMLHC